MADNATATCYFEPWFWLKPVHDLYFHNNFYQTHQTKPSSNIQHQTGLLFKQIHHQTWLIIQDPSSNKTHHPTSIFSKTHNKRYSQNPSLDKTDCLRYIIKQYTSSSKIKPSMHDPSSNKAPLSKIHHQIKVTIHNLSSNRTNVPLFKSFFFFKSLSNKINHKIKPIIVDLSSNRTHAPQV